MKYCPKCGYPNPDDAKFCMKCRYQFPDITQQPPTQPYPQPPPIPVPSYPQQPSYSQPPSKRKIPIIPIASAIAVVIVVIIVLTVVLPGIMDSGTTGITSSRGNALVSAADRAFGGNWKIESDRSATVTIFGNTVTVAYLNGTTIIGSLSSFTHSNLLGPSALGEISEISNYMLVNGRSTIYVDVIYNAENSSFTSSYSYPVFIEQVSHKYYYNGITFYCFPSTNNSISQILLPWCKSDQILTMYNGNLYVIYISGFNPTVEQIAIFLDNIVTRLG